jgi:hypothetical protein
MTGAFVPPRPPWRLHDLCPCGSNKQYNSCCLSPAGLLVSVPRLLPKEPVTGYAHPKCYLRPTHDCSTKISREHFISHTVLEAMGGEIEFGGLPWLPPETHLTIGPTSAISKVLCQRHNSTLSPLDAAAGRFFRALQNACRDINPIFGATDPLDVWHLVSGEAVELWCLKTLFGVFHAGLASSNGQRIRTTHHLDTDLFVNALAAKGLSYPAGLYLRITPTGVLDNVEERVVIVPLGDPQHEKVIGIRITLLSFEFDVILDPAEVNYSALAQEAVIHPWHLLLTDGGSRRHGFVMTWQDTRSIYAFPTYSTLPPSAAPVGRQSP